MGASGSCLFPVLPLAARTPSSPAPATANPVTQIRPRVSARNGTQGPPYVMKMVKDYDEKLKALQSGMEARVIDFMMIIQ